MNLFFNNSIKIGIYIAKPLGGSRTYNIDNIPFGLKSIIKEINWHDFTVEYCDKNNIDDFDFVLYSINSDKDYLILIRDFYKKNIKPKIIVGGSDAINIHLLKDVVDIIVLGRGEGQINEILKGGRYKNVCGRRMIIA